MECLKTNEEYIKYKNLLFLFALILFTVAEASMFVSFAVFDTYLMLNPVFLHFNYIFNVSI